MDLETFQKAFEKTKRGAFVSVVYKSAKNIDGVIYEKITTSVVRFVQYGHITGVEVKGVVNPNEKVLIPNTLYENTKTNNILVQFGTTNVKSKKLYYRNDIEIDKETYEKETNYKNYNKSPSPVFRIKLENLISITQHTK